MSKTHLCIYHHNCADGFGAAWVVRKALGDAVTFYPGKYYEEPPLQLATRRHVVIVDFSYPKDKLIELAEVAETVTVLDHHKTAYENLKSFTDDAYPHRVSYLSMGWGSFRMEAAMNGVWPIRALFDMNRSGVGLTWDWFFPNERRPELVNVLEDRDLWRFEKEPYKSMRPYTRQVQANVFSYPYTFEDWDHLFSQPIEALAVDGAAIERKHFKDIRELLGTMQQRRVIAGYNVPVANLPYTMSSDACHIMAQGEPFAACFWELSDGRVQYSLRSTVEGVDVSSIARLFGGGGHRSAAGFTVDKEADISHRDGPHG